MKLQWHPSKNRFVTSKCGKYKITPQVSMNSYPGKYTLKHMIPLGIAMRGVRTQRDCKIIAAGWHAAGEAA